MIELSFIGFQLPLLPTLYPIEDVSVITISVGVICISVVTGGSGTIACSCVTFYKVFTSMMVDHIAYTN